MDKPLKSVTHGQCDARSMVTFPAALHLEAQRHVCKVPGLLTESGTAGVELATTELQVQCPEH